MLIGIVDLDLILNKEKYKLNLDVMQIASYYRRKNIRVKLFITTKIEELDYCNQIYVIYNGENEVHFDELFSYFKTILIGRYFFNGVTALSSDICAATPDKTIYEALLNINYLPTGRKTILKNQLLKSDFLRLHNESNKKFLTNGSSEITIYDLDINLQDYKYIVSLNKNYNFYYPIKVKNYNELNNWLQIKTLKRCLSDMSFILSNFTEQDLNKIAALPQKNFNLFYLKMGEMSSEYWNFELKKIIKFLNSIKFFTYHIKLITLKIPDLNYYLTFKCVEKWYKYRNSKSVSDYFNTPQSLKFLEAIRLTDFELYQILKGEY